MENAIELIHGPVIAVDDRDMEDVQRTPKVLMRDPMAVHSAMSFPLMVLGLLSCILGDQLDPALAGRRQLDVSVHGYRRVMVATTVVIGLPINLASDRSDASGGNRLGPRRTR